MGADQEHRKIWGNNSELVNHRVSAALSPTSPVGVQLFVTEQRTERVIAQTQLLATRAKLLRSIPGIAPVCAAMLIAELPELGRMTSGKVAAITGSRQFHITAGQCGDAERLQADDSLCDMCCVRLRSRSHATIQFSSQSQSVSKSAESHTSSSSSQSRKGWSQSPMPSSKPTLLCNFSPVARHSC